jgi:dTDP-4-dehydrorhamnose reductase
MRLLVFGGWGQLGTDLAAVCEGRHDLVRPRRAEVDVVDVETVADAVSSARPDWVLDLAAFHKVEACEESPSSAFEVNAVGAWNVAVAARRVGARSLFVSTDYVFDGERREGYVEDDPPRPLNVYGVSKAAGERAVAIADPASVVVRASGLFGHAGSSGKGGNFVETMLSKAAAGGPISVVDDLVFSPTSTRDLAERIVMLVENGAPAGIYHGANAGSCSWYRFAQEIFRVAGSDVDLAPRASDAAGVRRPSRSILLDTRSTAAGLPPGRPWQEALRWYLEARRAPSTVGAGRS